MYARAGRALLIAALLAALGCGGSREDPILQLSAEEALEQGKALMVEKKYHQARKYLIHAYEIEPNSLSGREGLLLAADALYFQDNATGYIEAESRYRDFLNRFPTSDQAAYAQYRIASCLAQRVGKPDRDQETARKALNEFQDLVRLYPTSPYVQQAREEMRLVKDRLAEHEFVVGAFYMRFGLPASAAMRFERLLELYPEYTDKDKVLFNLCRAYERSEQPENAADACARLQAEYPESQYVEKLNGKTNQDKGGRSDGGSAAGAVTDGRL